MPLHLLLVSSIAPLEVSRRIVELGEAGQAWPAHVSQEPTGEPDCN